MKIQSRQSGKSISIEKALREYRIKHPNATIAYCSADNTRIEKPVTGETIRENIDNKGGE